uniref:RAB39a, member RAS oncogene family-like n=1 Tax=Myripristis murdjan TaxID=586833 RepID=A0A667Y1D9_9TELE
MQQLPYITPPLPPTLLYSVSTPPSIFPVFVPVSLLPAAMDLTLWQYQFRIIMLGDSTVGKSSLLKRYTEDMFLESINETVGVDFYVHFLEVEPGVRVKLQFWDTAGQERFRSVTRSYYRNSVGGLLVFDLTNQASFDHIKEWHAEVCDRVQPHKVVFILVGHKSDLATEGQRAVSRAEAETLAGQLGTLYVEASSKTGENVQEAFELLAILSPAVFSSEQKNRLHNIYRGDVSPRSCFAVIASQQGCGIVVS